MIKKKKIPLKIGWIETEYYCDKCGKKITKQEALDNSIVRRKKLDDKDPRIFDVWFEDWCTDCANNWDPYE